jgi:hypothetical protein
MMVIRLVPGSRGMLAADQSLEPIAVPLTLLRVFLDQQATLTLTLSFATGQLPQSGRACEVRLNKTAVVGGSRFR